jgi:hypothetical protein
MAHIYYIPILAAIQTMENIIRPIERRWLMRLNWSQSPEWVYAKMMEAANGESSLQYNDAVTILFEASAPTVLGGANRGMTRVQHAWRAMKFQHET